MKTTRRGFFGFIGVTPLVSGVFAYRDAEGSATIEAKDGEWFHDGESLGDIIYDVTPTETPLLDYVQISRTDGEPVHEWWEEDLS